VGRGKSGAARLWGATWKQASWGSRQTEADDGVLGRSRSCKCWCVKGRMVGAAWTEHVLFFFFFEVVEGIW